MNPYLLAAIPVALLLGYLRGIAAGRADERERMNHGMTIAMSYLLSPALHLLNGWNRGDMTEEDARGGYPGVRGEEEGEARHGATGDAGASRAA